MAKTDFTKVEEALAAGLRKMEVDKLLSIADENALEAKDGKNKKVNKITSEQSQLIAILKFELKQMHLSYDEICNQLKIDKDELKRLLKTTEEVMAADWEKINQLKDQLSTLKKELDAKREKPTDEALIEQQRKKQKSKRFNVNEKWLPLK